MRITEDIYLVGSLQLGISGRWDSHVYLVKGAEGLVLIDAGGGTDMDRIFENIRNEGFDPADIKALLLTHIHFDHSCGAAEIRERTGCQVYISARTRELLERGTAEEAGLDKAIAKGIYPEGFKFRNCVVDHPVHDGDTITAGGLEFRAIGVEGHSPDSICYLVEMDGARNLFIGDVLFYGGVIGLINAPGSTMEGYRQGLSRLAGLKVDGLYPGHYLFTVADGQRHIDAAIAQVNKGSVPLTVDQIGVIFSERDLLIMATTINIEQFSFRDAEQPGKHRLFLEVAPAGSGEQIGIPLLVANGRQAGKTLVAFAAVHGDELEGVQAIQDVFHQLDTDTMNGRLVAVPVANLPAFRAVQRTSPIDSLNLARTFPGRKDGSVTERIAYYLSSLIIPEGDFFFDLHSAAESLMPTMAGYDASGTEAARISKEAALRSGMPVVWGHPDVGPGRSLCAAIERGIPWMYLESPSGRRVSDVQLPFYVNALLNLLGYLKVIERDAPISHPKLHLIGSGDVDRIQSVNSAGFFVQKVRLLDQVQAGTLIGEVRDLFGIVIEEVRTLTSGHVAVLRSGPLVNPGDSVCLVAESIDEQVYASI